MKFCRSLGLEWPLGEIFSIQKYNVDNSGKFKNSYKNGLSSMLGQIYTFF